MQLWKRFRHQGTNLDRRNSLSGYAMDKKKKKLGTYLDTGYESRGQVTVDKG